MDVRTQHGILAFGKHPVNDSMIYGPCLEGVKVWAMICFELIQSEYSCAKTLLALKYSLEQFLNMTIHDPVIQELGASVCSYESRYLPSSNAFFELGQQVGVTGRIAGQLHRSGKAHAWARTQAQY